MTFDSLPTVVTKILDKVNAIEQLLSKRQEDMLDQPSTDRWLSLKELIEYLPGDISKATIYAKTHKREIPHKKFGRKLTFLQSEIDTYLNSFHRKTNAEINAQADAFIEKGDKK
ncbi:MAG: helix-turn-helix domain-containing protein [Bacteroidota bacterium]|nr:helix-turn-helix domain-containing protein [Bacteroidota bacterium]